MTKKLKSLLPIANLKWAMYISLLAVAIMGCTKEATNDQLKTDDLSINIQMPLVTSNIATRTAADEVKIKSAYVIVYSSTDLTKPKFAQKVLLENIKPAEGTAESHQILAFTPNDNIILGDEVHTIFNKEISTFTTIAKDDLIKSIMLTSTDGLVLLTDCLPMYGSGLWTSEGSPIIKVKRSVAKVQLKLDYGTGGKHVAGDMGSTFTTEKTTYKLYQLADQGYMDGSFMASTTSNPIAIIKDETIIDTESASMSDNYKGASFIYAYPYATQSIGAPFVKFTNKQSNISRIAMIMKNEISEGKFIYHRLDFYDQSAKQYLNIINNNHYSIRVRRVDIGGYGSATEALNTPASNVMFDIIVEEEGTSIISNGQYALNVNNLGCNFTANKVNESDVNSSVVFAKVNRTTSNDAVISGNTSFSVTLEDPILRIGNIDIKIKDAPTALGNDVTDLIITATGNGTVAFKYKIKLGNIEYTSELITVTSNASVVDIEGFVKDKGAINGYSTSVAFDLMVQKKYIFTAISSFKSEWDGLLSLTAPNIATQLTKFTTSPATTAIKAVESNGSNLKKFYFTAYRTAPGDSDIVGTITVTATLGDIAVSHTFNVNIITSCDLPSAAEDYGVKLANIFVADRNVGSVMPTGVAGDKYAYAQNYTNGALHPDNKPADKIQIAGNYHTWSATSTGVVTTGEVYNKCEKEFVLGSNGWRTPNYTSSSSGDFIIIRNNLMYSKNRAYIVDDKIVKSASDKKSSLRYVGCFFPLAGSKTSSTQVNGLYWSKSQTNSSYAYNLNVTTKSAALTQSGKLNGYSIRCVKGGVFVNGEKAVTTIATGAIETFTYDISSWPDSWSFTTDSPSWATATKTASTSKLTIALSRNTTAAARTAQIIVKNQVGESATITINQKKLVAIWADRNYGVDKSVTGVDLADRDKARGSFHSWHASQGLCENWSHDGHDDWLQPTITDFRELDQVITYGASLGKAAVYMQDDTPIYFPISGYSGTGHSYQYGQYWGAGSTGLRFSFAHYPEGLHSIGGYTPSYLFTLRCMRPNKS